MEDDAYIMKELSALATVRAGYPMRVSVDALPNGVSHVIQMRDVSEELSIDWNGVAQVCLPGKREPAWLKPGDILFAARGMKNYALVLNCDLPGPTVCSPHFFVVRVRDTENLLPDFLAWQINQKPSKDYFEREATGSYIPNVRRQVLEALKIVVPPVSRQKTVVAFANSVRAEEQSLRALVNNRKRQMEAVATGILRKGRR